jgi:hypothetical protein
MWNNLFETNEFEMLPYYKTYIDNGLNNISLKPFPEIKKNARSQLSVSCFPQIEQINVF